jgi:hypothetical protein
MSVSFTFQSAPQPLGQQSVPVLVYRYVSGQYTLLPFVRPLQVDMNEGAEVAIARFKYSFRTDELAPPDAIDRWDDVFPLSATGPNVVKNDDRLVIKEYNPDGSFVVAFDGFAQIPQLNVGPSQQEVTFEALDTAIRSWDKPIKRCLMRDGTQLSTAGDVWVHVPARFNPEGKPNATPVDGDGGVGDWKHPTFVDALLKLVPDVRRLWTISQAAKYILATANPQVDSSGNPIVPAPYVFNPDFEDLDTLLDSRIPLLGETDFDPDDPDTYSSEPIVCQDLDITGKPWPEALMELLTPHGFAIAFRTEQDSSGNPYHWLDVYRKNDAGDPNVNTLNYQASGRLDPGQTNVREMSLSRDIKDLANQFYLITEPIRYEAAFLLAPGFSIDPSDALAANLHKFIEKDPSFAANADKYRLFVFDECDEGHWSFEASAFFTTGGGDLTPLLGKPKGKIPQFVPRRRKPIHDLFSKPTGGYEPYNAQLWLSTNYQGDIPGVYSSVGDNANWQPVNGGWSLLHDRLGIRINIQDPNTWNIGKFAGTGIQFTSGKVPIVKCLAAPDSTNPIFNLLLTCVIEGDKALDTKAARRPSSPTQYVVEKCDETRDRFKVEIIDISSPFNTTGKQIINRDDRPNAQAYADQRRLAHEVGPLAGSFTVPRLTWDYSIGDRVSGVQGRQPDVSFASNAGLNAGEGAVYPSIVKLTRNYAGQQGVTGQLSDRRAEPAARRQS